MNGNASFEVADATRKGRIMRWEKWRRRAMRSLPLFCVFVNPCRFKEIRAVGNGEYEVRCLNINKPCIMQTTHRQVLKLNPRCTSSRIINAKRKREKYK